MPLDLSNLGGLTADARSAFRAQDSIDLPDVRPLSALVDRRVASLRRAGSKLPSAYRWRVVHPLLAVLRERSADATQYAEYVEELSEAILPHKGVLGEATAAFQEVVHDVYAGFLDAADRKGARLPDRDVLAPLVKWHALGDGEGPYTVGEDEDWEVSAGYVSLPITHAEQGLAGWTLLAHETAGHDILGANHDLTEELRTRVHSALGARSGLDRYWSERIEETASDIIGVLNMGPAAAIGLVSYFRGINSAWIGSARLQTEEEEEDEHPLDIFRGFLVAEVVRLLQFDDAEEWALAILREVRKDARGRVIRTTEGRFDEADVHASAAIVARTVALRELKSLEGHALSQIQNWRNSDEAVVLDLRRHFRRGARIPRKFSGGSYAAHAVSAAVVEALGGRAVRGTIVTLREILVRMHRRNPVRGT
jgi:hypothetical protein